MINFKKDDIIRLDMVSGTSDDPNDEKLSTNLKAINEYFADALKKDDPVLGNNVTIFSGGSTALFTFLDTENKTIVNVNLGDCLAMLKTLEGVLALNAEWDFKNHEE